jgi:hypothetical protein
LFVCPKVEGSDLLEDRNEICFQFFRFARAGQRVRPNSDRAYHEQQDEKKDTTNIVVIPSAVVVHHLVHFDKVGNVFGAAFLINIMSKVDVVDIMKLGTESDKGYRRENFQWQMGLGCRMQKSVLSRARRTMSILVL